MTTKPKTKPPKPVRTWDRLLWGVELSSLAHEQPLLIGTLWHDFPPGAARSGEPTRTLLFVTRTAARDWCRAKMHSYADRPKSDPCRRWQFRPVRVREVVALVRAARKKAKP